MSIVLDWVHPRRRLIGWADAGAPLSFGGSLEAVERELVLLGGAPFHGTICPEIPDGVIRHGWTAEPGMLEYRGELCAGQCDTRALGFYLAALLSTSPRAPREALLSLQLALYELCVNVVEHAEPLGDDPASLSLALRIRDGEIEGSLSDNCQRFDIASAQPSTPEAKVRDRESRGYGLALIHRCLDSLEHEFQGGGNTVHFSKRMHSCLQA